VPFAPGELIYLFARDITDRRQLEEERSRHLAVERERAARLRQLAMASIAMNSTVAIEEILQVVTEEARRMLDAERATGCLAVDNNWSKVHRAVSQAEDVASGLDFENSDLEASLRVFAGPLRRSIAELCVDPHWSSAARSPQNPAGVRNCICAPLTGRQGGNMGYLALCDRRDGDFSPEDESLLVQLAQMASLAVTNALYFEAREANRIKDEFLATLSHELRTPLTAILGWTWLLRSGNTDPSGSGEALEIIERNARAQAKLVDDMLDISRIISGKLRLNHQPVNFQTQVEAAVGALRPAAAAKHIGLEMHIQPDLAGTRGDPDRLHQVVSNLVSNSIKFTPEGGRIDVRLEGDAAQIRLTVQDTGVGIPPSFLPHVFERFLQAEAGSARPQGGLGLGLAIVRHLVELHGGNVEARSEGEGRGATFVVELPTTGSAAERGLEPSPVAMDTADGDGSSLQGLKILVVDDDHDSRTTITMVLRQHHATVIEAASAAEAMTRLESNGDARHTFDLLVSDIAMPGEDGCSLIGRVRRLEGRSAEHFPALAVSAFAREEDRSRALAAGFQAHLAKPVVPLQLVAAIASLVTARSKV
jgi:signal transduction histidine kinase